MIRVCKPEWQRKYESDQGVERADAQCGHTTQPKGFASEQERQEWARRVAQGQEGFGMYSEYYGKWTPEDKPMPTPAQYIQGRSPGKPGYVNPGFSEQVYQAWVPGPGSYYNPDPDYSGVIQPETRTQGTFLDALCKLK